MIKNVFVYGVLSFMLLAMVYFGNNAYTHAKAYEVTTASLVKEMSARNLAEFQLKELAETFSMGLYKNKKRSHLETVKGRGDEEKRLSKEATLYFMVLLLGILAAYFLLSLRAFTFFGAMAAAISLLFGLITPIMMVTIHKEVEYLGDVVLSFESKGILGSVAKLYANGSLVVAGVILLFSVIVPAFKTLSLLFVATFEHSPFAAKVVRLFKHLGKWSMIDVFVVAILLVYLTGGSSETSRSEVEIGLYFFLIYVLLSMVASLSADKMLHEKDLGKIA